MQKSQEKPPEPQVQQQTQAPQKLHPLIALNQMTGNLLNIKNHAIMIERVTGAKIEPINQNIMGLANQIDLLRDWMIQELKINPLQPMNRQQLRRMQKQLKKENTPKK